MCRENGRKTRRRWSITGALVVLAAAICAGQAYGQAHSCQSSVLPHSAWDASGDLDLWLPQLRTAQEITSTAPSPRRGRGQGEGAKDAAVISWAIQDSVQPCQFEETWEADTEDSESEDALSRISLLQPQPPLLPRPTLETAIPQPAAAAAMSTSLFGSADFGQSSIGRDLFTRVRSPGASVISGVEARPRVTTDVGDLLGKSPAAPGTAVQRRTPIVTDPRVRGSRIGQLAASGSYWVPARIDLDTSLSKLDSRLIQDVIVIGGPYSVQYGPGMDFIDVDPLHAPRYPEGFESHGSTGLDYDVNGEQWSGLQRVSAGSVDWGCDVSYGHRTANDYTAGDGQAFASSYNSRNLYLAMGKDLSDASSVELRALRLDQTGVEFPGYVFDMDYLVSDAYELAYVLVDQPHFDALRVEGWYNNTRFRGDAQNPSKRQEFPLLDFFRYVGFTDAETSSVGFSAATTWGRAGDPQLTLGTDFRFVKQELDEIASGRIGFQRIVDANSPLPRSESINPGVFLESTIPVSDRLTTTIGARVDWTRADVTDDPSEIDRLGFVPVALQSSLADILGTDQFQQHFTTEAVYVTGKYDLNEHWSLLAGAGHSQRPPSLTELYVAETFLLLLQNGLNTATGDPLLDPEKKTQLDLGLSWNYCRFRGRASGFHAWVHDYITFENLGVFRGPPAGQVEQEWLKYVNTEWAVLTGFELSGEYEASSRLTPFGTLRYVEGRDLTRNGDFATRRVTPGAPSVRIDGLPRGFFSGFAGGSQEPLPGIVPLEARLGVRLHPPSPALDWGLELSARVVDNQDRIATSLLELPTPGFTVWDLRSYWRPVDRLLLVAGVENFGDKNYREHLDFRNQSGIGIYQPGSNFYFGSELLY